MNPSDILMNVSDLNNREFQRDKTVDTLFPGMVISKPTPHGVNKSKAKEQIKETDDDIEYIVENCPKIKVVKKFFEQKIKEFPDDI